MEIPTTPETLDVFAQTVSLYENVLPNYNSVINFNLYEMVEQSSIPLHKIHKKLSQTNGKKSTTLDLEDPSSVEIPKMPIDNKTDQTVRLQKIDPSNTRLWA